MELRERESLDDADFVYRPSGCKQSHDYCFFSFPPHPMQVKCFLPFSSFLRSLLLYLCSLLPFSVLFFPFSLPSFIPSLDTESQVAHPSWCLTHDVVLTFWSSHFCLPYAGIAGVLQHAEVTVSLLPSPSFPNFLRWHLSKNFALS